MGPRLDDEHATLDSPDDLSDAVQPLHDVLVVGAGPHALAVVARLLEDRPSALYTDAEHARLSWLRQYAHSRRAPKGAARTLVRPPARAAAAAAGRPDLVVLDRHARPGWMPQWTTLFETLQIRTLRSPMFFHPGPADLDGLLAYAHRSGREGELTDIPGVVGKELSKHAKKQLAKKGRRPGGQDAINERSRHDYQTPGSQLFLDFCGDDVQTRYGLQDMVTSGEVVDLAYEDAPSTLLPPDDGAAAVPDKVMVATLKGGRQLVSRAVVLAIGNNSVPNVPEYLRRYADPSSECGVQGRAWCHTSAFAIPNFDFPPKDLCEKARMQQEPRLVVIGGGLTSAQVVDIAHRRGIRHITLLCRSHLKVKPFDVDLTWVDKFQNLNKMVFWGEDDYEARQHMIAEARNGGSVNQPYYKLLLDLQASGALDLRACTAVTDAQYSPALGWTLSTRGPDGAPRALARFDYLVAATGSAPAGHSTLLARLRAARPVRMLGGLPAFSHDLQWDAHTPLFVVGGLAALQLGPGAGNLGGAREGAERVANRLAALLPEKRAPADGARADTSQAQTNAQWQAEQAERRAGNHGGFFDVLEEAKA